MKPDYTQETAIVVIQSQGEEFFFSILSPEGKQLAFGSDLHQTREEAIQAAQRVIAITQYTLQES